MTPLTHAAVGTVIFQKVEKLRWGYAGWVIALALAFVSHYLLDTIPHFEGVVPIRNYKTNLDLMVGIGLVGILFALLLMRWNREAGRIWLVLFLWIGLGSYSFSWLRLVTAMAGLIYVARASKRLSSAACLLAGMVAVAPDLIPRGFRRLTLLHRQMHFHVDWATRIYLSFNPRPIPLSWRARITNPYFLTGYGLEILVEGFIFIGALYLFSRKKDSGKREQEKGVTEQQSLQPLEFSEKN